MSTSNHLHAVILTVLACSPVVAADSAEWNRNWPQWRGPLGTGVAPEATPPITWSESDNVKWKVEIPGSGTSSPIVWGDKVFVLTAIPAGQKAERGEAAAGNDPGQEPKPTEAQQFTVLCLDRQTGQTVWRKVAREQVPHEGHHPDHGFASASPSTDGKTLFAYFGSRGLYCYDMDGELKWDVDFGDMQTRRSFGEGSSPALYQDTVVVVWDHEGEDDFIVALDKTTGRELWRTPRNEDTSWTTPVVTEVNGKPQVIVAGTSAIRSYDLATGTEIWTGPGLTANVIPTPIVSEGVLYAMSGFRGASVQTIKLGAEGNLEGTDSVLWTYNRNTPYVPSPVLLDEFLYFGSGNNAMLSCLDAATGEAHFAAERLRGINGIYASQVAAGDHVFVLGRNGTCLVLEKGPELKIINTNKLEDGTDASMAIAGEEIFIRGHKYLYCLAEG